MKTSDSALNQIKKFERLRLKAYKDSAGVWTVGYGHAYVMPCAVVTKEEAEELFTKDISTIDAILSLYTMNQNQHDALADFCFNLGYNRLRESTLWRYVLSNPFCENVKKQFRRWIYIKGVPSTALKYRREWEIKRYFGQI